MFENRCFTGDFPEVINNPNHYYEGDLRHYFAVIMNAPNVHNSYHGLRHMLYVPWITYLACKHYVAVGRLDRRRARNVLVAATGHELGHPGFLRDDLLNIDVAIEYLREHIQLEDAPHFPEIAAILRATQYPHVDYGVDLTLEQAIIRDADVSQSFSPVWMGDILAGLGREMQKSPIEMLEAQEEYLRGVRFYSDFGQKYFGQTAIDAKIKEVQSLLTALKYRP